MTPRLESNQKVINFLDQSIREICTKAQEESNIHKPYVVEFLEPGSNIKVFETKVNFVNGDPEWQRNYPHVEDQGRLILTLRDGASLRQTLDMKNFKTVETSGSTQRESAAASD